LQETLHALQFVLQSIDNGMPEDFYSIDLMRAYAELGSILGEEVGDDLVNEIFSKFCMGK
jgi:tRNA modification GTPase